MSTQMAIGAGDTADDTVGDTAVADAVAGGEGVNDTVARLAALPGVGTASGIALRGSASGGERGRASRSPDGAGGPGRACEAGVSGPRGLVGVAEGPDSPSGTGDPAGVTNAAGVTNTAGADSRVLPVALPLAQLLPWGGVRRGSTVSVSGSTSVLLALLAEATSHGSWAAAVGMPRLGVLAAHELGVAIRRLALIPRPGADFAAVTAALLDGVDLVAVPAGTAYGTNGARHADTARRLSARARNRGSVLLTFGSWPGAEVELRCRTVGWSGTDDGYGRLTRRAVAIEATGRRGAARPRRAVLALPGPSGAIEQLDLAGRPQPVQPRPDHPQPAQPPERAPLAEVRAG